jgi:preprotein translocase subunit SecA
MDQLQGQIGLRGYAQRDPKIEYKREGYEIFEEMVWSVKEEVTRLLLRLQLAGPPVFRRSDIWQADQAQAVHREYQTFNAEREQAMAASQQGEEKPKPFVFGGARVGRNDPCPCGSRKKYKKCCGRGR